MGKLLRRIFEWIVDHASWDLAMQGLEKSKWKALVSSIGSGSLAVWEWLLKRTWPEIITIGLGAFALIWLLLELFIRSRTRRRISRKDMEDLPTATEPLEIIRLDRGQEKWRGAENWANFKRISEIGTEGCVELVPTQPRSAMDYSIEAPYRVCRRLRLTVKLPTGSYVQVAVTLKNTTGEQKTGYWLTFSIGDPKAKPRPDARDDKEMNCFVNGKHLGKGWIELNLSLEEQTSRAFGDRGLMFSELTTIRLRNALSISPIWVI
jgi:hypothetical protein